MSKEKPSNEVQVDVHHIPDISERPSKGTRNENGSSFTVGPCSNGQLQQLQNVLEQGFASVASNISSKINDAFKSFSERFELVEDEFMQSGLEDGEIEETVEDETAQSNNGGLDRQNARENDHDLQGTNVQRMIERAKGTDDSNQTIKEPSVLDGIREDLKTEETGPKVNEDLAEIANGLLQKGLTEDRIEEKLSKYPSPENCQALCKVKVNQLIWDNLNPNTRSQDLRFQKVQTAMTRGMAAIIRATDSVLEHVTTFPKGKEVVEQLTDALALCAHANSEINARRKELIKPDLHEEYKHLCSPSLPSSSLLFGDDLSKQVKELTEVNKVGRKMTRQSTKPYSRGRSLNFRKQGQYNKGKPFLGERQVAYNATPPYCVNSFKRKQQRPKHKAHQA